MSVSAQLGIYEALKSSGRHSSFNIWREEVLCEYYGVLAATSYFTVRIFYISKSSSYIESNRYFGVWPEHGYFYYF